MEPEIDAALLRKLVGYEPATGGLFWLRREPWMFSEGGHSAGHICARWNSMYAGAEAFTFSMPKGYRMGRIMRRPYLAHRVVWALFNGSWPGLLDHIDRDTTNNRISNLRVATRSQNAMNGGKPNISSSSRYRGVCLPKRTGTWVAYITVGKKRFHLGSFSSEEEAVAARRSAEGKYFGEFSAM